jgi:peptidoglycan/xylan/chitin deacetylase (PgdA/CDA1 family)
VEKNALLFLLLLALVGSTAYFASRLIAPAPTLGSEALLAEAEAPFSFSTTSAAVVPILVYHIVRPAYANDSAGIRAMRVTPEVFQEEMQWLRNEGYAVIPLRELEAHLTRGVRLPPKPVVITLDDDWEDQYVYAFPILKAFGYDATFFVPSNFPGNSSFISWDQLREMVAAGMTVGSHSESHPYLTRIESTSTLEAEIAGSKAELESELHVPITEFNYPFGAYTPRIIALVKAAGYAAARTDAYSKNNREKDLYQLPGLNAPTSLAASNGISRVHKFSTALGRR